MTALFIFLAFVINGFGRRFAGGLVEQWIGIDIGTVAARLIQVALLTATFIGMAFHLELDHLYSMWTGLFALAAFLGTTWGFPTWHLRWPPVNFRVSNMVPKTTGETISLSLNGFVAVAPVTLVITLAGPTACLVGLAGLARGPLYWVAYAWTPRWRWMGFEKWAADQNRWILQPTALTEFYSGGVFGAAIVLALMFN